MSNTPSLRELEHHGAFLERHIGPNDAEIAHMLRVVGHDSLDAMTDAIVPASIKSAQPLALPGVDPGVLDVRLLSPLDLAVSKLGRFAGHDRDDIAALARHGLIEAVSLRQRAQAALTAYVGDTARVQNTIDIACRIVDNTRPR